MSAPSALRAAAPLLVLCAGLAAATGRADDDAKEPVKVELKLAVRPGDVFRFRQAQRIAQRVRVMETDVDTTIDTAQTMTFTVEPARPDGLTDVKVTIGDVKGTFTSTLLGTFYFDSSKAKEDDSSTEDEGGIGTALQQFTLLAGRSYHVLFDARGRLVEIHGLKEILDETLKRSPALAGKDLGSLVDDASVKQQMQSQFAMFSDGPVAVGGKWTAETGTTATGATKAAMEYTLVSADDAKAVVKVKLGGVAAAEGAPATPSGSVEGTVTVSRADGLVLQSEITTHVVADVPSGEKKEGAGAKKTRIELTTTVTIERIGPEDAKPAAKEEPRPAPSTTPVTPPAPK
jgi:hypothetical protein